MGLAEEWTKAEMEEEEGKKRRVVLEDIRVYLRAGAMSRVRCAPIHAAAQIRDLLAEDHSDEEDAVEEGVGDRLEKAAEELERMAGVPLGSSGPPRRPAPVAPTAKSTGEEQEEESAPPSNSEEDSQATSASDEEPAAAAAAAAEERPSAKKRKSDEAAAAAAAHGATANGTGKKKGKKGKAEQ